MYRIRLLTARPVREACLRLIAARGSSDAAVSVTELNATEQARLEQFMAASPDDIRVKGDDRHIVIGVTLIQIVDNQMDASGRPLPALRASESKRPGELTALLEIGDNAFLSTGPRRRVPLLKYDPPGPDQLGVKLYFPRTLPDGTALIGNSDKNLRLEMRIKSGEIAVIFKLRALAYKGRLEI